MGIVNKTRGKTVMGMYDVLSDPSYSTEIRKRTTTLTATQIKALNTTPLSVLSAPGVGKANVVMDIFLTNQFLTTAFASATTLEFRYTSSNGAKVSADVDTTFLNATATAYDVAPRPSTLLVPVPNAPIAISAPGGDPTQGLGTIKVQVFYRTVFV